MAGTPHPRGTLPDIVCLCTNGIVRRGNVGFFPPVFSFSGMNSELRLYTHPLPPSGLARSLARSRCRLWVLEKERERETRDQASYMDRSMDGSMDLNSELRTQDSEPRTQDSELRTQDTKLRQDSELIAQKDGEHVP